MLADVIVATFPQKTTVTYILMLKSSYSFGLLLQIVLPTCPPAHRSRSGRSLERRNDTKYNVSRAGEIG